MISRRSIITAALAPLLSKPVLSRGIFPPKGGAGSLTFTPDGTRIMSIGPTIVSRWGTWSLGPTFTGGGVFYAMLNGRPVTQVEASQGIVLAWGTVPSTYWLEINYGGNIYAFPNGDTGVCSYQGYSWLTNHTTVPPPYPITGPGQALPNYMPPYTPSADGSSITAPTVSTLTTIDGTWSFGSVNSLYGGYDLMLNGIPIGDNRGGDNTDGGLTRKIGVMGLEVAGQGQLFALLADSTWRSFVGLQPSPSSGPPSPVTLPVPVSLTVTPVGPNPYPSVPYTSSSGTLIGSLSMTMSDGTTGAPLTSEFLFQPNGAGSVTISYTAPNLYTMGTQPMGTAAPGNLVVTRNGASSALAITVFYY
jgi:hypothetical protein